MRKWFYVLELTGGYYYVGISNNLVQRTAQHQGGAGAAWTKLHPPTRVLFQHEHEVADYRAAELIENEITVRLMIEHGWTKVRGGFFCATSEAEVEKSLKAHGHWDRVLQSTVAPQAAPVDWLESWTEVSRLARVFHCDGCTKESRDALLAYLLGLRCHRNWRPDLEPGLDEAYWGPRGVLRVLLSLQADKVIGFKLQDAFAVLCAGMQMGRGGRQPWGHLFLAAWDAYSPSATSDQERRVQAWLSEVSSRTPDLRYDEVTSVLFPELRWRLRGAGVSIAPQGR